MFKPCVRDTNTPITRLSEFMDVIMKNLVAISFLLFTLLSLASCHKAEPTAKEQTLYAAAAKLEYVGESKGGYKMITSEIDAMDSFSDLCMMPTSDEFTGDWIYKFVFNPKEIVIGGKEIVVLFGENNASVDGVTYIPEEGVSYSSILEWVAIKYNQFDYELQYED